LLITHRNTRDWMQNHTGSAAHTGTPRTRSRHAVFAIDMVEAGFVALAPDCLRDGARIQPGQRPSDTTRFYEQFPHWSIHGKDILQRFQRAGGWVAALARCAALGARLRTEAALFEALTIGFG
jgi:hypothetical protein